MTSYVVQRNGREATAEELAPLAFAGFAHMTAMQVRDGGVRGLDLHLERLRTASLAMFGQALPDDQVRSYLRTAVGGSPSDHSLLANVFSGAGEFTAADRPLNVLVRTSPATSGPTGPLSLAAVEHERMLPELKHVGEVAKTYYLRQAVARGFDDAAFVDRRGRFSEASIWNLAFWDGEAVVWPEAEMLGGITMTILRRQLEQLGVPQRTAEITPDGLPDLAGAVVMNSWTPGVAVHRIDTTPITAAPEFVELLHEAYAAEPLVAP
ncbi:aminotransferase class IV family protein [Saccharopolyspora sp. NPDC002686]|uniref:aminotransferase class IV family protein n=1 Tax=Saccharopolyspora sp. NPDC002686 TaxID=3154541 RepID=UPI0033283A36